MFNEAYNKTICTYPESLFALKTRRMQTVLVTLLFSIIPLSIIIPTNIAIIVKLVIHSTIRRNLGVNTNVDEVTKVTCMLLSVTVTFVILLVPFSVFLAISEESNTGLHVILTNLPYLNISINFYLYFLSGNMFRVEVKALLSKWFTKCSKTKESDEFTQLSCVTTKANSQTLYSQSRSRKDRINEDTLAYLATFCTNSYSNLVFFESFRLHFISVQENCVSSKTARFIVFLNNTNSYFPVLIQFSSSVYLFSLPFHFCPYVLFVMSFRFYFFNKIFISKVCDIDYNKVIVYKSCVRIE